MFTTTVAHLKPLNPPGKTKSTTKNINTINASLDMTFVQNFTPPDFQVKTFMPSISPNLNSYSWWQRHKKSENGEIYTAGENFTLLPAVSDGKWTNLTNLLFLQHCSCSAITPFYPGWESRSTLNTLSRSCCQYVNICPIDSVQCNEGWNILD